MSFFWLCQLRTEVKGGGWDLVVCRSEFTNTLEAVRASTQAVVVRRQQNIKENKVTSIEGGYWNDRKACCINARLHVQCAYVAFLLLSGL